MKDAIYQWLDYNQRMQIARELGVTSRRQVYNVLTGKSKNFELLARLVEAAEHNKQLYERAKQLEAAA